MSRIYLDRETSALQSKVLSRIMGEFLGKQRLPMIILDTSAVVKNRAMFSARGAGILGFSMFCARPGCSRWTSTWSWTGRGWRRP